MGRVVGGLLCAAIVGGCAAPVERAPAVLASPLPACFCYVDEVVGGVRVDLKYAGNDNFVGRPIDGYAGKRAILRKDAAVALRRAAEQLESQGYGLVIWDAYRPMRALRDFRDWTAGPDERTRPVFFPRITKREIYEKKYIGDSSEHTWGIALDLSLYRLADGELVDMGGRHDLLDPASATDSEEVSARQRANRHLLRDAMQRAGFANYAKEWWHYRLRNSRPWAAYDFVIHD